MNFLFCFGDEKINMYILYHFHSKIYNVDKRYVVSYIIKRSNRNVVFLGDLKKNKCCP